MAASNKTSTITAREFNQHISRAKRAAQDGPVIITERGKASYVLLRHDEFLRSVKSSGGRQNALDALTDQNATDQDVEFPRMTVTITSPDLS